ncbi:MAG TPA: bacillithiol system redox-active protein YtxJ [Chitinophagaceae bacterium]|nr:bacillithiol system redox-active protein YtxJ [Chitinophagaceae bacterium]
MNWNTLSSVEQLEEIKSASYQQPQLIFKHSTRCSISSMVRSRLERSETPNNISFHYLDLLAYRSLSNQVAEDFSVYHESPQVLLIKNGECVYDESHQGINMDEIAEQAAL